MKLQIDLRTQNNLIDADAHFYFDFPFNGDFSFCLNHLLRISSIRAGKMQLNPDVKDARLLFRQANRFTVALPPGTPELTVSYRGCVDGNHTVVNRDICAVNFYSCWYPDETGVPPENITVRFHTGSYTHVIHAEYRERERVWIYRPRDFDCNILALRHPHQKISLPYLNFFYLDDPASMADMYFTSYLEAAEFCRGLYATPRLGKTSMCVLPGGNAYDGYCRDGLIVLGGFAHDPSYVRHLLAHEIAHNWCTGADISWEDWLNETTAEWTALLYELHRKDTDKFLSVIADKREKAKSCPPVKSADGRWPEGIHDKGVMIFYDIYLNYGQVYIIKMLRAFDLLPVKTTQAYAEVIRNTINPHIADMILEKIEQ